MECHSQCSLFLLFSQITRISFHLHSPCPVSSWTSLHTFGSLARSQISTLLTPHGFPALHLKTWHSYLFEGVCVFFVSFIWVWKIDYIQLLTCLYLKVKDWFFSYTWQMRKSWCLIQYQRMSLICHLHGNSGIVFHLLFNFAQTIEQNVACEIAKCSREWGFFQL